MANTFREVYKKTGSSSYQLVGNVGVGGVKLDIMKGATSSTAGEIGLVPKPTNQNYFLKGNGVRDCIFPIGSIYFSLIDTNPSSFFGGTWERISNGKFLVGVDENDNSFSKARNTGGEKEHALSVAEMPSHTHTWKTLLKNTGLTSSGFSMMTPGTGTTYNTESQGGNAPHNNLPPYLSCYMWERVS